MAFLQIPGSARRQPFEEEVLVGPPGKSLAPGRISYDPERAIELTVMGADWLPEVGDRTKSFWPALQGETFTGTSFTLLESGIRNLQSSGDRSRAEIVGQTLALGAHFGAAEDVKFNYLSLSLRGLLEWLTGSYSGIGPTLNRPRADSAFEILQVEVEDASMQMTVDSLESGGPYRRVEESSSGITIEVPVPLSLSEWHDQWISPLRDLMIFANRERSVVEGISGSPDIADPFASVRIFERNETTIGPRSHYSFYQRDLLPAGIIDTAKLVQAWFKLHRSLGSSSAFFFGTLNSPAITIENEFLNLMAFAEAYHRTLHDEKPLSDVDHEAYCKTMLKSLSGEDASVRGLYARDLRYSNRQSQRERLTWVVRRAALETWTDSFVEELVSTGSDTRNWLTHWGDKGDRVAEGADLAHFNRRLLFVIESNMLDDLGLSQEDADTCLRHGYVWDFPFSEP
ncbi:MAG TPA: HEPN domain-containing protein [Solirubrobacterales bacterium]|nr:HEPN domain-containing protein [Solirubrobacterales bacterium]